MDNVRRMNTPRKNLSRIWFDKRLFSLLCISTFLFSVCEAAIKGEIVDAETNEPISNAFVVATWERSGLHGTSCYAVETAVTDANGRYVLNGPMKLFLTDREPAEIYAHKNGYRSDALISNAGYRIVVHHLKRPVGKLFRSKLSNDLRLKYLVRLTVITSCYGAGEDNNKKYPLFKSLLDEAIPLAKTSGQLKIIEDLCDEVAYVAIRKDGHPTAKEIDIETARFSKENLPECQSINIDKYENQRLLQTFLSNDKSRIERELNAGFDIDTRFEHHRTALAIAALKGMLGVIQTLIEVGADPNTMDADFRLILQQVILEKKLSRERKLEVIQLLTQLGADTGMPDEWNSTPFISAVKNGEADVVSAMVKSGANVNDRDLVAEGFSMIYRRNPPLQYARSVEIARILIDAGADPNLKGKSGDTAIMVAAGLGNTQIVKLLINNGANVNAQGNSGWSALIYASRGYKQAMPSRKGDYLEILTALMVAGADLTQKNSWGHTAEYFADDEAIRAVFRKYSNVGEASNKRIEIDAVTPRD